MAKISEVLNKKKVDGDIGLEIEAEGKLLPTLGIPYWSCEDDASLRGYYPETRCEYVLKKPLPIVEVKNAILQLFEAGRKYKTEWKFSFRCSTHVHLNVLDLEEEELYSLVYTYLLLEDPMVRYCGRERIHNRFALRTQDAEETLQYIDLLFKEGPRCPYLENGNNIRYAGLNLNALYKYGSLEFRSMRGTEDIGVLSNWVEAIYALKRFSKGKTVDQVKEMFLDLGPLEFAKAVFGDLHKIFKYQKLDYDMSLSFSLSLPLTYQKRKVTKGQIKEEVKKKIENRIWDDLVAANQRQLFQRQLFRGIRVPA